MHLGACTLEGAGGLTIHGTCVVVFSLERVWKRE